MDKQNRAVRLQVTPANKTDKARESLARIDRIEQQTFALCRDSYRFQGVLRGMPIAWRQPVVMYDDVGLIHHMSHMEFLSSGARCAQNSRRLALSIAPHRDAVDWHLRSGGTQPNQQPRLGRTAATGNNDGVEIGPENGCLFENLPGSLNVTEGAKWLMSLG